MNPKGLLKKMVPKPRFQLAFFVFTMMSAISIILQWQLLDAVQTNKPVVMAPPDAKLQLDTATPERIVFYNIFIPEGNASKNALDIVKEQLLKKRTSYTVAPAEVRYTLIGNKNATGSVQKICGSGAAPCQLLRYVAEGNEGLTLESLYDYCLENPESIVTYLHNKGSFHPSERNDKLRTMLTKATFSEACQNLPPILSFAEEDNKNKNNRRTECNVCSARFSPIPHFHMAGNMWTARCSYISRLIHPRKFADKMDDFIEYVLSINDTSIPKPTPYQIRQEYPIGLKRYALEHWLASHPSVQPCDVYPNSMYQYAYSNLPQTRDRWKPKLQSAPWMSLSKFKAHFGKGPWFCGPARLLEFDFLYGQKPRPNSFIWSYYAEKIDDCPIPLNQSEYNSKRENTVVRGLEKSDKSH